MLKNFLYDVIHHLNDDKITFEVSFDGNFMKVCVGDVVCVNQDLEEAIVSASLLHMKNKLLNEVTPCQDE